MSDRLTRPTVRLAGGLPDGNLSNLESRSGSLLSVDPSPVYALVRLTRTRLVEDDDQDGAETAVVKVRALEVLDDRHLTKMLDLVGPAGTMQDLIVALRAERTGDNPIPFDDDGSAARADQAMTELRDWQAAADLDDAGLTTAWTTYFAGHQLGDVPTWRDAAPELIREFVLAMEDQAAADDDQHGERSAETEHVTLAMEDAAAAPAPARVPAATFATGLTAVPDPS